MPNLAHFFHCDSLSLVITALVLFAALSVASFSSRYLAGDRRKAAFYRYLGGLIAAVFIMVSADHLVLLCAAFAASNFLLTRLMLHKQEWRAARESARLALNNFTLGTLFLGSGCLILYQTTGQTSIQAILKMPLGDNASTLSAGFIFLAALTQSALWPCHRWLISSLNSPAPVSAIMHAGLVNGGGFILARFAPLFLEQPFLLNIIFATGIVTALLGTLWKLLQNDIKRMLACSTMGQMGFMIAQCGLGLFPAAVAHLCWHGLFKAYLFLASGSAAQEKRLDLDYPPQMQHLLLALICGAGGAYLFALVTEKEIFSGDTNLFLILLVMIAGTQFALPLARKGPLTQTPFILGLTMAAGAIHGMSVHLVETALSPLGISRPLPLNALHMIALAALSEAWLTIIFGRWTVGAKHCPDWLLKYYVCMLNASQPHPQTITTQRNHYQY